MVPNGPEVQEVFVCLFVCFFAHLFICLFDCLVGWLIRRFILTFPFCIFPFKISVCDIVQTVQYNFSILLSVLKLHREWIMLLHCWFVLLVCTYCKSVEMERRMYKMCSLCKTEKWHHPRFYCSKECQGKPLSCWRAVIRRLMVIYSVKNVLSPSLFLSLPHCL
jgi:hypothetical protein